jgi:hypothetical protein
LFILFVTTSIRGLGGLVPLSYKAPDIIYTSFTLRSAFQRPHEGVGMALYTLAMVFLFQFLREGKTRFIVLSLMANLLLTVFYPYYFANYLLTFGVFIIWQKKNIKSHIYVLIATGSVLALATYSYFLNIQHSSFMIAVNEIQPKLTPLHRSNSHHPG